MWIYLQKYFAHSWFSKLWDRYKLPSWSDVTGTLYVGCLTDNEKYRSNLGSWFFSIFTHIFFHPPSSNLFDFFINGLLNFRFLSFSGCGWTSEPPYKPPNKWDSNRRASPSFATNVTDGQSVNTLFFFIFFFPLLYSDRIAQRRRALSQETPKFDPR